LEIQGHVRRAAICPTEENDLQTRRLRERVAAEFAALDGILHKAGLTSAGPQIPFDSSGTNDFENLDEDAMEEDATAHDHITNDFVPIEHKPLPLPSYTNFEAENANLELLLRQKQAQRILDSIRATVADKSFQYSHVMRVAPRKSVVTRARATIAKLNVKIANYCCAYSRCRSAMVRLGADDDVLSRFQILTRADVKASTALVDPNAAGASTLRLSWIWHNHGLMHSTQTDTLLECMFFFSQSMFVF
jgi:hypothetical protein